MGEKFQVLRELAGWSQYRLSAETGIDRTRVSLIENGHVAPTDAEKSSIESVLLAAIAIRAERFSGILNGGEL